MIGRLRLRGMMREIAWGELVEMVRGKMLYVSRDGEIRKCIP
jgi:hypothetical protein